MIGYVILCTILLVTNLIYVNSILILRVKLHLNDPRHKILEDKQNYKSGTLLYNICICDFVSGHAWNFKFLKMKFLQELVRSYWVANVDLLLAS